MRPRLLFAVLPLAVGAAVGASPAAAFTAEPACRTAEVRVHAEAVFGHFATPAAAKPLMRRAAALGFKGLTIENEGCGDFELEIDGADERDRSSFAREAHDAGFDVTFEQTAPALQFQQGQVIGLLGSKRTIREANALMWRLAGTGFLYLDLARARTRWLVVMPQVPIGHALSIAHEAATAGFRISFQPGVKP